MRFAPLSLLAPLHGEHSLPEVPVWAVFVEDLQLESADRMERALASYSVVAWRQLFLTLDARLDPHGPADTILDEHEWKALLAYHYSGRKLPVQPPTKREAISLIARLGGFLAHKGDGEPGVKTIWRGFAHLHDLSDGYRLAAESLYSCAFTEIREWEALWERAGVRVRADEGQWRRRIVFVRR
jgi:hypothetical protein